MSYDEKIGIKAWAEADRPREKLLLHGRRHLTDAELLAILIGSGSREESAVELSRRILNTYKNDLGAIGKASVKDLSRFKGIGNAKALLIMAALEIGRRRKNLPADAAKRITSSRDTFEYMQPHFADLNHEECWMILLNRANLLLSKHLISKGGQSGTIVDPKIIFKMALEHNAAYMTLTHNHPSGEIVPSTEDIRLTKKMADAGKLLDLHVVDHLIITNHKYYSFADNGLI